ncbi:MAG TPA: SDR family NAD(P)-dependent oxidoreductase [Mycobacteriales bacterium]|jgi:NAD(P)-dependent dehydrogenase (short-subunit alcohol dehydrogenase family)|nr:SDR family NAD(P)-dependent oxidoreductase [Mycobacteriales bacterium]
MDHPITLITGANKGLGYETARRLLAAGHTVLLGARDRVRGEAAAGELGAAFVPIDVTDEAGVGAAADHVRERHGRLDVLINNAGIVGPRGPLADTTAAEALATFDTNVLGVVRVTHAFLPLLRESEHPRIVNVSSGTGTISRMEEIGWNQEVAPAIYSTSKAALSMLTLHYAHALPGILVNAVDPGYTATALNDFQGTQTIAQGTDLIVELATLPPGGPTATVRRHWTTPA